MSEDRSVLSRPAGPPDQVLRYGPLPEHVVDVRCGAARHRAQDKPLVMIVHGGFWRPAYDRTHTGPMAEALAAAGWTVATIEYRRTPGVPDATVDDVRLAIDAVPALVPHHNGKLLLVGHSAGGHLVLWAASSCASTSLLGVLALAPASDLQAAHSRGLGDDAVRAFLGSEPQQRPDLDPARLPAPRVAAMVLHGDADAIVPLAISQAYDARIRSGMTARGAQPRLVALAGAGHFAVIDPLSREWPMVLQSLTTLAGA